MNTKSVIEKRRENEYQSEILRKIPRLSKEVFDEKVAEGSINFGNREVNGFPPGFHAVVVSSVIASDAFASYKKEDGDIISYLRYFINNSLILMADEFKTGRVLEGDILNNPLNYYKKVSGIWYRYHDHKAVSIHLGILNNAELLDRTVEIYEERII